MTILRELDRKYTSGKHEGVFRHIQAKTSPQHFAEKDVAILLAGIRVGGSGVRDCGRYIEAKFIHETVVGRPGHPPLKNQATLAENMGKSGSWVARLKSAYEFVPKFVEHVDDDPNPRKLATEKFSVLEEISEARVIGSQLRDFDNNAYEELRNDVFKEYWDARFLEEFYDNEDAWAQLKAGEKHVANKPAQQTRDRSSHPKAKIAAMPQLVRRAIDRGEDGFDDDDVASLQQTIDLIEDKVHDGVHPYRLALKKATRTLNKASKADVIDLHPSDVEDLHEAFAYFDGLVGQHHQSGGV